MKIKGTALVARREIVTRRFGPEAWVQLVDDMGKAYPYFRSPLVASSLVPVREFLAFHDELVRRFFGGDTHIYFDLGRDSARWALTEGPYKKFLKRKDIAAFVDSIPNLSNAYWEQGTTSYSAKLDGGAVELEVQGLPEWHPYFEYLVVGYIGAALEMLCGGVAQTEMLQGGSGTAYRYRFHLPKGVLE